MCFNTDAKGVTIEEGGSACWEGTDEYHMADTGCRGSWRALSFMEVL